MPTGSKLINRETHSFKLKGADPPL